MGLICERCDNEIISKFVYVCSSCQSDFCEDCADELDFCPNCRGELELCRRYEVSKGE